MSATGAVAEMDRLLATWAQRLERIDENLFALEEEPAYRAMIHPPTHARLTGETRELAARAAATLAELFVERDHLRQVLEQARLTRAEIGFFGDDAKVDAIRRLLYGASIVLERRATTLTSRTLLGSAAVEDTMTPSALVTRMASSFEKARRDIAEIATAWREVESELTDLEERSASLAEQAEKLSVGELTSVVDVRAQVARLRAARVVDPLGARSTLLALSRRVEDLRGTLDENLVRRQRVFSRLAETEPRMNRLRATNERAVAARELCAREFAGAASSLPAPVAPRVVEDLAGWRARLVQTVAEGRIQPAAVGLERWHAALDAELAAAGRALEQATLLAARRDELRGRLSARRAQAAALLARARPPVAPVIREQLHELAEAAATLLSVSPLSLDRVEEAVVRYERAVTTSVPRG